MGNLEDQHHSELKNIYLALLIKTKYIKSRKAYNQVLRPLLEDLFVLHNESIVINIDSSTQVFGALATISADNLLAHDLAGFRCAFNSGSICRFCIILHGDKQAHINEEKLELRTEEMHSYHLEVLSGDVKANVYGVAKQFPFAILPYFEETNAFPPDVMHDILKEVVPILLKLVLTSFYKDKIILISQVKIEMEAFYYGKNDIKSRPIVLPATIVTPANRSIPGTAMEKWCLIRA